MAERNIVQDYLKDNARIRNRFSKANLDVPAKRLARSIRETPSYKGFRKKKVVSGGLTAGGISGLLTGALQSKGTNIKQRLIRGGLGALAGGLLGAGAGASSARKSSKRTAKRMVRSIAEKSLMREISKTRNVHKYLSKPGTQRVSVKRPWGPELYSG